MASGRGPSKEPAAKAYKAQPADWLASERSELLMTNNHVGQYVDANKHRHWFLRLSDAIYHHQKDPMQARMVAKLYAFMHDFLPHGFTGRWSHIKGEDVMNIIMSARKDMSVSRHKATQNAQASFEYLEAWMQKGAGWKEAAEKNSELAGRKRGPKRAPILYTPAGLAALLSISYPDPKFRVWVGSLQIDWMMHDEIDVREGFWEGITRNDVDTIFQLSKTRYSEFPLLADYNLLFGPDFVRAQQDIRPFLPQWAKDLNLTLDGITKDVEPDAEASGAAHEDKDEDAPSHAVQHGTDALNAEPIPTMIISDNEDLDDELDRLSDLSSLPSMGEPSGYDKPATNNSNAGDIAMEEPSGSVSSDTHTHGKLPMTRKVEVTMPPVDMTKLLNSSTGTDESVLLEWFLEKMDTWDDDGTLAVWCRGWVGRINWAHSFEEQAIFRSLFLQSIRRVHGLSASSTTPAHAAFTEAFVLLDTEDHQKRHMPSDPETLRQLRSIEQLPIYKPVIEAKLKLARLAKHREGRHLLATVFEKQLAFFYDLFQHENLAKCIIYKYFL